MLEDADKIIMTSDYGGFKAGAKAVVVKENNFFIARFKNATKTEAWIRNSLRIKKIKLVVTCR